MRALLVLAMLSIAAGGAAADEPRTEGEKIRARLRSSQAVEVAWGLHDAIEARLIGADDLVVGVLDRWPHGAGPGTERVRRLAIDAIIELDIDLSPERIQRLAPDLPTAELLILAARDPGTHRALLRPLLTRSTSDDAWTATCNLLVGIRDPVAAEHLVRRLRLESHLTLCDPGDSKRRHGIGGEMHGSWRSACGRSVRWDDHAWPPLTRWMLLSSPVQGARLVAKGREPIYAERRDVSRGEWVGTGSGGEPWKERAAQAYVADLLGWDAGRLRTALRDDRTVPFAGLEAWARSLEEARWDLAQVWLRILVACWFADLLSPEQILRLPPQIALVVLDERSTKEPALPEIPKLSPSGR